MTLAAIPANWHLPHFSAEGERSFQTNYYARVRPTLRLVSCLLALAICLYGTLGLSERAPFVSAFNIPELLLCLLVFGLTWVPSFGRIWQPVMIAAGWFVAMLMFGALSSQMLASPPPVPLSDPIAAQIIPRLFFTLQVCVFMVTLAAFRLTFWPTVALQCGVVVVTAGIFASYLGGGGDGESWHPLLAFFEPVLIVLLGVLLTSFAQEKLARGGFEYNRRLSELQIYEHQRRLETEKMLHILNGAIGSIVHDLGNPLTSVQTGAELTKQVLSEEKTDRETLNELNDIVLRGAQLLSFLRVSLIEQTRVLEGKPVPVEPKPVSVRSLVEAGVSFQKQRFTHNHTLQIQGDDDLCICADQMKMVTVLMNLVGNALKYSDGEVCISWRPQQEMLHLAVMDSGTQGQGLTQQQAGQLFSAFGRLEEHAAIEGTGLGLLSVQKIVEAHGGQIWIEGFTDGTPTSPSFSTHPDAGAPLLTPPFRTAFVLTCPLA